MAVGAPLAPDSMQALEIFLPLFWGRGNPIDMLGSNIPRMKFFSITPISGKWTICGWALEDYSRIDRVSFRSTFPARPQTRRSPE